MAKPVMFALLLLGAVVAAGLFGALHNQLSYSVGPDYFTTFKFPQFGLEPDAGRLGAAWVGFRASWWMGLVIGALPLLYGLARMRKRSTFLGAGLGAIGLAVIAATIGVLIGLVLGFVAQGFWEFDVPEQAAPEPFIRAALMHGGAYLGGLVGILLGLWTMHSALLFERRTS